MSRLSRRENDGWLQVAALLDMGAPTQNLTNKRAGGRVTGRVTR
jgi:hypothetical protein